MRCRSRHETQRLRLWYDSDGGHGRGELCNCSAGSRSGGKLILLQIANHLQSLMIIQALSVSGRRAFKATAFHCNTLY